MSQLLPHSFLLKTWPRVVPHLNGLPALQKSHPGTFLFRMHALLTYRLTPRRRTPACNTKATYACMSHDPATEDRPPARQRANAHDTSAAVSRMTQGYQQITDSREPLVWLFRMQIELDIHEGRMRMHCGCACQCTMWLHSASSNPSRSGTAPSGESPAPQSSTTVACESIAR